MASSQVYDSVNVIDHDFGSQTYTGYVVVTFASRFSSFAQVYKIRKTSTLKEIKSSFGECADWHSGDLKYIYKGKIVEDGDTPQRLRMQNGDMVEVVAEAKFGGKCTENRMKDLKGKNFECLSVMNPTESITVIARLQDGFARSFRIKPSTDLRKLQHEFEKQAGETYLRFLFDGERISGRVSPQDMGIEDGDTIDVFRMMHGG